MSLKPGTQCIVIAAKLPNNLYTSIDVLGRVGTLERIVPGNWSSKYGIELDHILIFPGSPTFHAFHRRCLVPIAPPGDPDAVPTRSTEPEEIVR